MSVLYKERLAVAQKSAARRRAVEILRRKEAAKSGKRPVSNGLFRPGKHREPLAYRKQRKHKSSQMKRLNPRKLKRATPKHLKKRVYHRCGACRENYAHKHNYYLCERCVKKYSEVAESSQVVAGSCE